MQAEIIAVGTELLLGEIANTNGQYVSKRLAEYGIDTFYHTCVGDNAGRILEVLKIACSRSEVIILTGGLGPTDDDLTKETLADFLDLPLTLDEPSFARIKEFFHTRNRDMPPSNRKQAEIPLGSKPIPNHFGTAPGVYLEHQGRIFILLPGPPHELQPMFDNEALPMLIKNSKHHQKAIIYSRTLRFFGIGESDLAERVEDLLKSQNNPTIAPLCKESDVTLRITAKAADPLAAEALINPVQDVIIERLSDYYYGSDDDTLISQVHQYLLDSGKTVSVAESCTGGLLSGMFTTLPNSSQYFIEGIACYSNQAKLRLGVSEDTLNAHGAVSRQVAEQLASLVKKRASTDFGIGITGIAGPSAGGESKPVGLVYIGIAIGDQVSVHELRLHGSRDFIRMRTANTALFLLLKQLPD